MGYLHIDNLYKNVTIMLFKECYALEKIHGTSAHISWSHIDGADSEIKFFSGGEKHAKFIALFDGIKLRKLFEEYFPDVNVTLFGEAYGGKQQGMSATYGKELKFIVFDVKVGETWLNVINAEDVTNKMGLEFISYKKVPTSLISLDYERDLPSVQSIRNGIKEVKIREGVVLRPLEEYKDNRGNRVIAKHKREEFKETRTQRVVDPAKLKILEDAKEIAKEWVTPMRLNHVLDKLGNPTEIEETGKVIKAMSEDIYREAKGEIVESKVTISAIGKLTAITYKHKISKLKGNT